MTLVGTSNLLHNSDFKAKTQVYKLAIIGCGPKGLYGLDRLLAQLYKSFKVETPQVEIHLFNSSTYFGAGDIYRCDQPAYLLMNYPNGNINIWNKDSVVNEPLSFSEWLSNFSNSLDDLANQYSSRALVGRYLLEGYLQLKSYSSSHIRIIDHCSKVFDLQQDDSGYTLFYKNRVAEKSFISNFQQLLFTTGHPRQPEEQYTIDEARKTVSFIYPVDKHLARVSAGSRVAIKGMGLTFIDAVLALTEGRGGRFEHGLSNKLTYIPSGQEPKVMYPFSTSGLPMIPRKADTRPSAPLKFFNRTYLTKQEIDVTNFTEGLWPIILLEMKIAYYQVLMRQYGYILSVFSDRLTIEEEIVEFHKLYPHEKAFNSAILLDPLKGKKEDDHLLITSYIDYTLKQASLGTDGSPFAAAADSWRQMSSLFNELYSFSGLSAQSQAVFDRHYRGQLNRITYGPPLINMRKIRAIAEAGLLNFSFARLPKIVLHRTELHFVLVDQKNNSQTTDFLIDARIPRHTIAGSTDDLYQNLLKKGLIRPFMNQDETGSYAPGCIDLSKDGHPININGETLIQLTFSGTPTEGVTYDNDTLSTDRNDFVSDWAKRVVDEIKSKETNLNHYE